MRTILAAIFALGVALAAQAETFLGSDSQPYESQIRLQSATHQGDSYDTVTGRVAMNGSLGGPVALLSDVNALPVWIDNLKLVTPVDQRSLIDRNIYMRFSAPAGLDDRDGLMRFVASSEGPNVVVLSLVGIDDFPEHAGAVRMKDVRGRFRFEQLQDGVLAVEFQLHYDSSVSPVFLANLSVKQQVEQTLVRMRRLIEGSLRDISLRGPLARQLGI